MPSGVNDTIAGAVVDVIIGSGADTSLFGTNLYLDLLTTAPSDDNGTGAVSWGQGRTLVTNDGTNFPGSASGRAKTGSAVTMSTNTSGSTITAVAFAWYSASTGGTYKGGGPLPSGSLTIPDGTTPVLTPTLASPSPS